MATVLESLTKKVETLGEGKIYEEHFFEPENLIAIWEFEDPRIYKQIFNLDNKGGLGIEKSLKSFLVEVKDSLSTCYYILDSACLSIDFICKYQVRETIRELPLSLITYLRVLCSKKAPVEISLDDNFIYIVFEDSISKADKQSVEPKPKLKKREKEVGKKYVLELPLPVHNTDSLDLAVIELFKEVLELDKTEDLEDNSIPLDLSNILFNKESLQVYKYEVETPRGKLRYIATDGLSLNLVVCPIEIAKHYEKDTVVHTELFEANEYTEKYLIPEDADVDYEEENDIANMIGEENDINEC